MNGTFEVGATYSRAMIGDSNIHETMKVIKRTEKTITVEYDGEVRRFKPFTHRGEECVKTGSWRFATIFSASDKVA